METILKSPLTELQLEMLKLFSNPVSDKDLLALKKFLFQYFADKAMNSAELKTILNKQ